MQRAIVVTGPGLFGRLVEQVLDAGVVNAGQLPGRDGEFDLSRGLCIDADGDPEQLRGATNW